MESGKAIDAETVNIASDCGDRPPGDGGLEPRRRNDEVEETGGQTVGDPDTGACSYARRAKGLCEPSLPITLSSRPAGYPVNLLRQRAQ